MSRHIFISYAIEDRETADSLCEFLENSGWQCWLAPRNILPGADWGESIIDAINESQLMILVYSDPASRSLQVKREVERASSKGVTILPFRIQETPVSKSLDFHLGNSQWIDALSRDIGPHLQFLKEVVGHLIGNPPTDDTEKRDSPRGPSLAPERVVIRNGAPRRPFWPKSARISIGLASIVVLAVAAYFGWGQWRAFRNGGFEEHLNKAKTYESNGEFDEAIEEINMALAADPTKWLGYRERGRLYYSRGYARGVMDDFSHAVQDLETAVKLNQNDDIARQVLGQTHMMLRQWDLAETDLTASLKLNPGNLFSWIARASLYQQKQNYKAAIADLTEALKLAPDNAQVLGGLGDIYILTGNYDKAVEKFTRAIDLYPNNPVLRMRRSEAYAGMGKIKEAQIDKLEAQKR